MARWATPWRRKSRFPRLIASNVVAGAIWLASALFLVTLPSCTPAVVNPKISRQLTALKAKKIHINLLRLEHRVRTEGTPLAATAIAMGMSTIGESVSLEIFVSPLNATVIRKFRVPGVTVRHVSRQYRRVLAVISDLTLLDALARIPEVRMIAPEYGATTKVRTTDYYRYVQLGELLDVR